MTNKTQAFTMEQVEAQKIVWDKEKTLITLRQWVLGNGIKDINEANKIIHWVWTGTLPDQPEDQQESTETVSLEEKKQEQES